MKKIKIILLSVMLCFTLIACSHNEEPSNIVDNELKTESAHTVFEKSKIYNREQKYGFLDHTMFTEYYTGGTLRCGTDFDEGEYYIMSLYEPTPIYNVVENPSDLSWSYYGIIRKISISKGQYISTDGDILIPSNLIDTDNWHKYGAYLVGQDLPAGDYKVTTLAEEYNSEIQHITGISGGYQISNDTPFNTPVDCNPLFDGHDYISLTEGQYITLINAHLQHVDDVEMKTDAATKKGSSTEGTDTTKSDSYSSSSKSSSTSKITHYCDAPDCTREGTKSYAGIGGQTEYYCFTHYNEIIDIMSDMEEDVGKSSYSKHTCEECSREGTYSIVGISGSTEYYCSTHYRELKELLEMFE